MSLMASCGSTKIKKNKELPPLDRFAEVEVFHESLPPFGYEVICDADVNSKGNFTSTTRKGYVGKAKEIARECGVNKAVILSLSGLTSGSGANVNVRIQAIVQTTEKDKITKKDPEELKKLAAAASQNKLNSIDTLFKRYELNPEQAKRSPLDNHILNTLMIKMALNGSRCPVKSMNHIFEKYGAHISHYDTFKAYGARLSVSTRKVLECPSKAVVSSFEKLTPQRRKEVIISLNASLSDYLNRGRKPLKSLKANFNSLYPLMKKDIDSSCSKDSTNTLCSLKENIEKIKTVLLK